MSLSYFKEFLEKYFIYKKYETYKIIEHSHVQCTNFKKRYYAVLLKEGPVYYTSFISFFQPPPGTFVIALLFLRV